MWNLYIRRTIVIRRDRDYFEEVLCLAMARRSWELECRSWKKAYMVRYSNFSLRFAKYVVLVQLPSHRKIIGWWVVRVLFLNGSEWAGLRNIQHFSIVSYKEERAIWDRDYLCRWPVPRKRARAQLLATADKGGVTLDSAILICERSMLDCEPWNWWSVRRRKRSVATRTREEWKDSGPMLCHLKIPCHLHSRAAVLQTLLLQRSSLIFDHWTTELKGWHRGDWGFSTIQTLFGYS